MAFFNKCRRMDVTKGATLCQGGDTLFRLDCYTTSTMRSWISGSESEGAPQPSAIIIFFCKIYNMARCRRSPGRLKKPTVIPTLEDIRCVGISCGSAVSFSVSEDGEKISLKLKQPFFYSNRF